MTDWSSCAWQAVPTPPPAPPLVDTAPLLSTLVQSGAALVAIIAGLLVARLVALVGERKSLERRVKELTEIRSARQQDLAEASGALLKEDAKSFINDIVAEFFDNPGKSFEDFFNDHQPEGRSAEELRPYFDDFRQQVKAVGERLGFDALVEAQPDDWPDQRVELLEQFRKPFERDVAKRMIKIVESGWKARRRTTFPYLASLDVPFANPTWDSAIYAARFTNANASYRDLVRSEANAEAALESAELELQHAQRALAAVARPEGLVAAMAVLAGITLAGIVLPLLQMTFGGTALSTGMRGLYAGLFIVSLVVFFGYLGVEIRLITRPSKID